MARGVTVAGSEGCKSCSLVIPVGNASSVNMTRDGNTVVIRPIIPFAVTFQGRNFSFTELRLFHPAPVKVEGVQADAVLQCTDGNNLMVFIPFKKSDVSSPSLSFLTAIAGKLSQLRVMDESTRTYGQVDVVTDVWSLSNLVTGTDPYFAWVNSELEQYVKADTQCDRYIGWKSKAGAQVIYFRNPVGVLSSDMQTLMTTVGPVRPSAVLSSISRPLYKPGPPRAAAPQPKAAVSTFKVDAGLGYALAYFFSALFVLFAVAIVSFAIQSPRGQEAVTGIQDVAKTTVDSTVVQSTQTPKSEVDVFGTLNKAVALFTKPSTAR